MPLPSVLKLDSRFVSVLLLVLLSGLTSSAQEHSQYDRGTPPQNAAGVSPIGSYSSSDIGTVNLANGGLNIKLPIGLVGGRGLSLPITLNYSSKVWSASRGEDDDNSLDSGPVTRKVVYASYAEADYSIDYYNRVVPGWTIGAQPLLRARIIDIGANPNSCLPSYKLTKLTLILPDRGEIELRDDVKDGAPIAVPANSPCSYRDGNRGARWHASDGSGLIFVSDNNNGPVQGYLAGYVITADGTRYRFEDNLAPYQGIGLARCHSITDRNGNQITISYPNAAEVRYTDQLGRVTTVQRSVADPSNPSVTVDLLITFPDYNNQPRYYKVKFGPMSEHYRAGINPALPVGTGNKDCDITPHAYNQIPIGTALFPNSWGKYAQFIDQENVVSKLILPDGRALNFKYNEYGEIAEVQLPTGGKVQYDYAPSVLPAGNTLNWEKSASGPNVESDVNDIDRALVTRRTYANGSTLESTWSYGYGPTGSEVKVYSGTTNGPLLSFEKHYFLAGARFLYQQLQDPDGSGYSLWSTGLERRTEVLNVSGTVISASEQDWSQRTPLQWTTGFQQEQPENDNRVNESRRYLDNGSFAKTITLYDNVNYPRANNIAEVKEYDFDQALKRRTVTSYLSTNNGANYQTDDAIHLLGLPKTQTVYDGNIQVARTETEYDVYTDGIHDLLTSYETVSQHDGNYGSAKKTRGNATRIGVWLNTTNSYIYSYQRYDIVGNVVEIKDGRGNVSTISFADDFGDGSSPGSVAQNPTTPTYALPTLITSPPPVAGAAVHTARSQYDYWTGQLTGFKDRNNVITQTIYDDPFNRPVLIKAALNTSVEARTRMYYAPATTEFGITLANNDVLTASDQINVDDKTLRSWTITDGFGRTVESWKRDPQGDVKVITVYDGLGRVKQTSNPFQSSLGETALYTTMVYDLAGRVTSVTMPGNAVVTTEYSGDLTLVTDPQSKKRMSQTNALGQLTKVWEITPNDATTYPGIQPVSFAGQSLYAYQTNYDYNALGALVRVTQGSQQRFFLYDSLKRLIRARNPEQNTYGPISNLTDTFGNSAWSVKYEYDANGNLIQKTDARGTVSTYAYDALNRNTTINYSDTAVEPDIKRVYDGATKGVGRFWSSYAGGDETVGVNVEKTVIYSYDELGRPQIQRQQFKAGGVWQPQIYQTSRTYNRAGAVTGQSYPSQHTTTYSYDVAGRTNSFSGNLGDGASHTYSTGIIYSPFGGMSKEQFGTTTPIYNKLFYNSRGQLAEIRESTSYTGPTDTSWNRGAIINHYSEQCSDICGGSNSSTPMTDNNGNLRKQGIYIPNNEQIPTTDYTLRLQQFDYDALNRLHWVREMKDGTEQWRQQFTYDRWGNRTINTATTYGVGINATSFEKEEATNRLYSPGDLALPIASRRMQYDDAGNLKRDTYGGSGDRVYDAENKMIRAWGGNNQWQEYSYNADGQRTRRKINGVETWQIYGFDGELLAEYAANGAVDSPQKEYGYRNGQLLVTATAGAAGSNAQPVSWANAVGVSVSGNSLTKTAGNGWSAGAASTQTIAAADGYVEFSAPTTGDSMIGLSNGDPDQSYAGLDFAIHVDLGNASVWENGVNRGAVGSYVAGDRFRVAVENGVVKYRKNGTLLYTSTVTPTFPLLVDTSLYLNGSTLTNVVWWANVNSTGNVSWTNAVGVSASGNNLTKTAGNGWSAGATSTQTVAAGDGYVEFSAPTTGDSMIGLSNGDPDQSYAGLDFAIHIDLGNASVWENGVNRGAVGSYVAGDRFRVAVENGIVKYRKNGVLLYTSTVAPTYPLLVDTSLYLNGSTLTNVIISSGSGAAATAKLNWLVTDQLGTPRIVFDQTGSLTVVDQNGNYVSGLIRHDYLPFGEELFAGTSGRTKAQGYSVGDGVRQQFTQYERDNETGLDYAHARYYGSSLGRFTTTDPLMASGQPTAPQTWNRYSYGLNNPLKHIDPSGMNPDDIGTAVDQRRQQEEQRRQQQQPPPPGGPVSPRPIKIDVGPVPLMEGEVAWPTTLKIVEGNNQTYNGDPLISPSGIVIDPEPNYGVGRTVDYIIRDQSTNPMTTGVLLKEEVKPTNADAIALWNHTAVQTHPQRPNENGIVPDTLGLVSRSPASLTYLQQNPNLNATFSQTLTVYGAFGQEFRTAIKLENNYTLTKSGVAITRGKPVSSARPTQ